MRVRGFARSAIQILDRRPKPPGTLCPDLPRSGKGFGLRWDQKTPLDEFIRHHRLCAPESPIRIHLGCGQKPFVGYVNVDYPPESHQVMQEVGADILADVTLLQCKPGTLEEIRLHHVFEHFDRVLGLAMLARWARWLALGGTLIVETPDLEGVARTFLKTKNFRIRMAMARHLAGDQSLPWGMHLDHWWPERYRETLSKLGFKVVKTVSERWDDPPHLSNAVVKARLEKRLDAEAMKTSLHIILRESLINDSEEETYKVWSRKLSSLLAVE